MNIAKYFFNWLTGQNFTLYLGGGGGGGAPQQSTSTSYQTNIPEYAKPYVETMLGATQKQLFQGTPQKGGGFDITGFQPYKSYGGTYDASGNQTSYDPGKSIAGFQPMQQQAMSNAANMQSNPETFAQGVGGYMSPFAQYALQPQLQEASRQSAIQGTQQQAQAAQAGAFGGGRDALMRSERERNLGQQQSNIMATGMQNAYNQAQQQYNTGFQQNLGINALQAQYGGQQQALEQQKINQSMQDFANAQQYPLMQLGTMSNMIRGLPMQASTTNQYVAAPNSVTQAIGAVGAGTSLANALKGASGGLPKEFKKSGIMSYAEGGQADSKLDTIAKLASIARDTGNLPSLSYSAGGISNDIEHDLYNMDEDDLQKQLKESSSPAVKRMAQRILREKQMENQPGMAGGGIIAFKEGDKVIGPDDSSEARQAASVVFGPRASGAVSDNPVTPPDKSGILQAAPTPREQANARATVQPPDEPQVEDTLSKMPPYFKAEYLKAKALAERPEADTLKDIKEQAGPNVGAQEQRAKMMAERANADDEAQRQRWMRAAEFFARWGSTPGSTLVAGLNAVKESVPNVISDEKEAKKLRMAIDNSIGELDQATRLEETGQRKEARAIKEKNAERMQKVADIIAEAQMKQTHEEAENQRTFQTNQAHLQAAADTAAQGLKGTMYHADMQVRAAQLHKDAQLAMVASTNADRNERKINDQYIAANKAEEAELGRIANERSGKDHQANVNVVNRTRMAATDEEGRFDPSKIPAPLRPGYESAIKNIEETELKWAGRAQNAQRVTETFRNKALGGKTSPAGGGGNPPPLPTGAKLD